MPSPRWCLVPEKVWNLSDFSLYYSASVPPVSKPFFLSQQYVTLIILFVGWRPDLLIARSPGDLPLYFIGWHSILHFHSTIPAFAHFRQLHLAPSLEAIWICLDREIWLILWHQVGTPVSFYKVGPLGIGSSIYMSIILFLASIKCRLNAQSSEWWSQSINEVEPAKSKDTKKIELWNIALISETLVDFADLWLAITVILTRTIFRIKLPLLFWGWDRHAQQLSVSIGAPPVRLVEFPSFMSWLKIGWFWLSWHWELLFFH